MLRTAHYLHFCNFPNISDTFRLVCKSVLHRATPISVMSKSKHKAMAQAQCKSISVDLETAKMFQKLSCTTIKIGAIFFI